MNVNQAASTFVTGTLTLTGNDDQLADKLQCKRVWLCASATDTPGAHTNAADSFIGGYNTAGTPALKYPRRIVKTDTVGYYVHVKKSDAFYLKGTAGDKIEYIIEI